MPTRPALLAMCSLTVLTASRAESLPALSKPDEALRVELQWLFLGVVPPERVRPRAATIDLDEGAPVALVVLDQEPDRVRVVQDVGGVRVAVRLPRDQLARVATREVGLMRTRGGHVPSGDEDGMYALPGLIVGDPQGDAASVHIDDGNAKLDGWISTDAVGDVFVPEATGRVDAFGGPGTRIVDRHRRTLATVHTAPALALQDLGGGRGALHGGDWIARGTIRHGRAGDANVPIEKRFAVDDDETGLARGPALHRGDCLFAKDGTLVGVELDERSDVPVDARGDADMLVHTLTGDVALYAHGDRRLGFVSCVR